MYEIIRDAGCKILLYCGKAAGGGEEASAAVCCVELNYRFLPQWMFYHDLAIAAKRRTEYRHDLISEVTRLQTTKEDLLK